MSDFFPTKRQNTKFYYLYMKIKIFYLYKKHPRKFGFLLTIFISFFIYGFIYIPIPEKMEIGCLNINGTFQSEEKKPSDLSKGSIITNTTFEFSDALSKELNKNFKINPAILPYKFYLSATNVLKFTATEPKIGRIMAKTILFKGEQSTLELGHGEFILLNKIPRRTKNIDKIIKSKSNFDSVRLSGMGNAPIEVAPGDSFDITSIIDSHGKELFSADLSSSKTCLIQIYRLLPKFIYWMFRFFISLTSFIAIIGLIKLLIKFLWNPKDFFTK